MTIEDHAVQNTRAVEHDFAADCRVVGVAPGLAAATALLEMGDRLGVSTLIETGEPVTVAELAAAADLNETGVAGYCEALESAALSIILEAKPAVAVELDSGTCRLLTEILPNSRAVGLDLDQASCVAAE